MNSRGQSLVLFVLLIPIFFLVMLGIYNIGRMVLLKSELNNINYLATYYGIDRIQDDDAVQVVMDMIIKNKDDIDNIDIEIIDDKIYINLEDTINMGVSFLNNFDVFKIKTSYIGYLENGEKVVERNE